MLRLLQISKFDILQLDHLETAERDVVISLMQKIKHIIQTDVVSSLVAATCGVSLQEVISSTASLLHTILKSSNWQDVEMSITPVLSSYQFKLGDECRSVVLEIFKRCTEGTYPASNFGDLIFELWDMHQADDTEATAGGQLVQDFISKYKTKRS
jgi:hypothetical protein